MGSIAFCSKSDESTFDVSFFAPKPPDFEVLLLLLPRLLIIPRRPLTGRAEDLIIEGFLGAVAAATTGGAEFFMTPLPSLPVEDVDSSLLLFDGGGAAAALSSLILVRKFLKKLVRIFR